MSEVEPKLTAYEKKLLEESVSAYMDALDEKEDAIDELKEELHVTRELDEVIADYRIKRTKLGELIIKI